MRHTEPESTLNKKEPNPQWESDGKLFPGKFDNQEGNLDYSDKDIQEIVASLNIFPGNCHFLKPGR